LARSEKYEWIFGVNYTSDDFEEQNVATGVRPRHENQQTLSGFVNNLWQITRAINLESGLRLDNY
jgi:outer membrane receptor for ferrienterochelin and colicin